jgi:uncharacterized protein (DUF302 family)
VQSFSRRPVGDQLASDAVEVNQSMPGDVGSIKYSLLEPFDKAVGSVCRSLENRGLRVVGQLDVARRVERHLGIALPPCKILFVLPGTATLTRLGIHPWAAVFLPLHVVVSCKGGETEIEIQNRVHSGPQAGDTSVVAPVVELQAQISNAIEAIAMRPSLV